MDCGVPCRVPFVQNSGPCPDGMHKTSQSQTLVWKLPTAGGTRHHVYRAISLPLLQRTHRDGSEGKTPRYASSRIADEWLRIALSKHQLFLGSSLQFVAKTVQTTDRCIDSLLRCRCGGCHRSAALRNKVRMGFSAGATGHAGQARILSRCRRAFLAHLRLRRAKADAKHPQTTC